MCRSVATSDQASSMRSMSLQMIQTVNGNIRHIIRVMALSVRIWLVDAACQVFPKAEIDEVNMLTWAIAADAIADDASAHTVDVLTDVSEPGQASQATALREASEASRQRLADLDEGKVQEVQEVQAPSMIRRDSTLTIPSPTARDAEVMHSNEAGTFVRNARGREFKLWLSPS